MRVLLFIGLVLAATAGWARATPLLAGDEPTRVALRSVWEDMRMGRWHQAERRLAALRKQADPAVACAVRYAEGNLWQFRMPGNDLARARAAYEWVVTQHPQQALAAWSLLALARIPDLNVLRPAPAEAVPLYRRVMAEYPASDAAQEAALHLGLALWEAEGAAGAAKAVVELEAWLAARPHPLYEAQFHLLLGRLYRYPLADYPAAVKHLSRALELGLLTATQRVKTCWTLAQLAERYLQDRDLAVRYYTKFLVEYPRDANAFRAKQALERLGAPVPEVEDLSLAGITQRRAAAAEAARP